MRRMGGADDEGRDRPTGAAMETAATADRLGLSATAANGGGKGALTAGAASAELPPHESSTARSPGGGAQQSWASTERIVSAQGQGDSRASKKPTTPATAIALRPARLIFDPTPIILQPPYRQDRPFSCVFSRRTGRNCATPIMMAQRLRPSTQVGSGEAPHPHPGVHDDDTLARR